MKKRQIISLCASLVLLTYVDFARAQSAETDSKEKRKTSASAGREPGSAKDGRTFEMQYKDGKLVELRVNNKRIDPADYPKYQAEMEDILAGNTEERKKRTMEDRRAKIEYEEASRDRMKALKEAEFEKMELEQKHLAEDMMAMKQKKENEMMMNEKLLMEKEQENRYLENKKMEQEARMRFMADKKMLRDLIGDIISAGLVKNADALKSFSLTENEFVINGETKAADVQKKFSGKYLTTPGFGIYYGNVNRTGSGIFFDSKDLEKE